MKNRSGMLKEDELPKPGCRNGDDDSEFEDYYLFCGEEMEFLKSVKSDVCARCSSDELSWDRPVQMIGFLRQKIVEFVETKNKNRDKMYWLNLPTHDKYLQDMVDFMHRQLQKKKADPFSNLPIRKRRSVRVIVKRTFMHIPLEKEDDSNSNLPTRKRRFPRVFMECHHHERPYKRRFPVAPIHSGKGISSCGQELPDSVEIGGKEKLSRNLESSSRTIIIGESSNRCCNEPPPMAIPTGAPLADPNPNRAPLADEPREPVPVATGEPREAAAEEPSPMATGEPREAAAVPRVFIMRRVLHSSDCSDHQQRVSMPCSQVKNAEEFLIGEEFRMLETAPYLPIKVIDPAGRMYDAHLRKTKSGLRTFSYAIGKPWNDIRKGNGFSVGTKLLIWALRGDDHQLQILLERSLE